MNFFKAIIAGLGALGMLFAGQQAPFQSLGAAVPIIQALFETSLQASLTTNATSATLVSGTDLAGNQLNGYYCFTVDAGTTQNEFMCGNASGTALTNLVRGVNPVLGISSNVALEFAHRRGADVKMTDAPYLSIYSNVLNGSSSIPGILQYDSTLAPTSTIGSNPYNIPDVQFVASTSFAGTVNASVIQKGISQLSTQAQMAAHTALGSTGASLVDQTANDSLVASTSPIGVVASGTLDPSFLLNGNYALGSTTVQSLTSASTTLNGTTTIPSATSTILTTNSSGVVGPIGQGASTGSLIQYYNGRWNSGIAETFASSSVSASSTLYVNVSTTTFPIASSGSVYEFSIAFSSNPSLQGVSTTVYLNNGNGSTTLETCATTGGNPSSGLLTGRILMQNATGSEVIYGMYTPSGNCSVSAASQINQYFSVNFATTTSLNINSRGQGNITTLASTSIYMIQ